MRNLVKIPIFCIFLTGGIIYSQQTRSCIISFDPMFGNKELVFNKYYPINDNDSVLIENLKFYISSFEFLKHEQVVFSEKNSFHLIDLSKTDRHQFLITVPGGLNFDEIKFNIGIDSITNVSGALGGDLDPTMAMYWTWQSGYINVKVEGRSNICSTYKNEFSFHLGGYQKPNASLQTIHLKADAEKPVVITVDIQKFLDEIDLVKKNHIMSPCMDAFLLSAKFSQIFNVR